MKRQLTTEQIRARDARREKFRGIVKTVANMQPLERDALAARMLGVATCEGRQLSLHNLCLIASQSPTATIVGGFRQWLKHGRAVRKGEHGLMIWCPKLHGIKTEVTPDGETTKDGEHVGFLIGTVFDVSQTDPVADIVDPYGRITGETTHRVNVLELEVS